MIPYVQIPPFRLFGLIPIQPFGLLVGLAIIVGYLLARRRAVAIGFDPQLFAEAMVWMVGLSLVMAHLFDVLFYYPEQIRQDPLVLLTIWGSISSFGGFIGGGLAAYLFCKRRGLPLRKLADAVVFGLTPAWIVGRLGCAIAHDHPGRPTTFLLGVRYPDGIVRHDLGFEEMLLAVLLSLLLFALRKVRPFDGFHTALLLLVYAPARFLLDFLRVADKTYLGLTAAQYLCVAMFGLGVYLVWTGLRATPAAEPGGFERPVPP